MATHGLRVLLVTHEDDVFGCDGFAVVGHMEPHFYVGLDAASAISQHSGTNVRLMGLDNERATVWRLANGLHTHETRAKRIERSE